MTEPRETTRTQSERLYFKRFVGFVSDPSGEVVSVDFARALEAETQELAEALERINRYLHSDRIDLWHLEANAAADLMQMRRFTDTALTRHRAKQEVQS